MRGMISSGSRGPLSLTHNFTLSSCTLLPISISASGYRSGVLGVLHILCAPVLASWHHRVPAAGIVPLYLHRELIGSYSANTSLTNWFRSTSDNARQRTGVFTDLYHFSWHSPANDSMCRAFSTARHRFHELGSELRRSRSADSWMGSGDFDFVSQPPGHFAPRCITLCLHHGSHIVEHHNKPVIRTVRQPRSAQEPICLPSILAISIWAFVQTVLPLTAFGRFPRGNVAARWSNTGFKRWVLLAACMKGCPTKSSRGTPAIGGSPVECPQHRHVH